MHETVQLLFNHYFGTTAFNYLAIKRLLELIIHRIESLAKAYNEIMCGLFGAKKDFAKSFELERLRFYTTAYSTVDIDRQWGMPDSVSISVTLHRARTMKSTQPSTSHCARQ